MTTRYHSSTGKLYSFQKLCCTLTLFAAAFTGRSETVYQNLTDYTGYYAGQFGTAYSEIADDVHLGGTGRIFESLTIAYWMQGVEDLDPKATMTVKLYAMDGAPTGPYSAENQGSFGDNTPGTELFSGVVCLDGPDDFYLATLTDSSRSIILPEHVAVGVSFTGINFDDIDAGPLIFDPPTIGGSDSDFWIRGYQADPLSPWGLFLPEVIGCPFPVNFGLQIDTVPDAGSWLNLLALPGLLAFQSLLNRRAARK